MASSHKLIILSLLIISISLNSLAQASSDAKSLILPISKDATTLQYLTSLSIGTPLVKKSLVVDLGGQHLWMDCDGYKSSTYKPSPCGSASCSIAKSTGCRQNCNPSNPSTSGCHNNTCYVLSKNTIKGNLEVGEVSRDTIALQSTGRSKSGPIVTIPNFIFACANAFDMNNLPSGVQGMLGLGRYKIGFPTQVSSALGGSFPRKFAICLPSNSTSNGVILFGDSPYVFNSIYNTSETIDISYRISHTRLYVNTIKTGSSIQVRGDECPEYFVKVRSIWVNNQELPINSSLLDFQATGVGGTRITTTQPYTILESSIYKALVKAFDEEISGQKVTKVSPVAPFKDCYTKGLMEVSSVGLSVPQITFMFESKKVYWPMFGDNVVVELSSDVVCLGFMDGGSADVVTTPIVIGALQLQNNLIEFDLASSRVGFTSSIILGEVECSTYKY